MKAVRDKDATEFLPDALAVRNAPLPWWARNSILWMTAFFLFFLLWACLGQVDIIVSANGKIVSDHPTIVMKPLERTVIKQVLVAVGDRVRAGQELVLFDPPGIRVVSPYPYANVSETDCLSRPTSGT